MRLLILVALAALTVWLIGRSLKRRPGGGASGGRVERGATPLVQDPVCRTFIPRETAVVVHGTDADHYFCSERCAECYRREHA